MSNEVSVFWAVMGGAALVQSWFPDWVTPFCPRVRLPNGMEIWSVVLPGQEPDYSHHAPMEPHTDIMVKTMDLHITRYPITANIGAVFDGDWEIGMGFLFLGDDPEFVRDGRGIVYCWYRKTY